MSDQGDLFADPRTERLRREMLAELRKPWPGPPAAVEPSDEEKVAFCEAFVASSQPRPYQCPTPS